MFKRRIEAREDAGVSLKYAEEIDAYKNKCVRSRSFTGVRPFGARC